MASTRIRVYRTFYCATGQGCSARICGGNARTAWGRDATQAGLAADPRWLPYGARARVEGQILVHDDTFGRAQRERDWKAGVKHIDIRVAGRTHAEVAQMGAGWLEVEILPAAPEVRP